MRIRTPDGMTYDLDECELIDEDDSNTNNQNKLAEEMFKQIGILIANEKGGDG